MQRVFAADAPDRWWVADLTQHPTGEDWLHLATVIDAFSRRVVGWAMGERPTTELPTDALNMAFWNGRPAGGLVHHADHGAQYTDCHLRAHRGLLQPLPAPF
ncbi:DDE-type integrase/transposase/recombinase [Geochorda subterranea]|uniref:DDE-type integrase/transposase/recombinase n=1 Tax=Geochorda subterranea TaxID=3109564 RepID=A0ABZ1BQT2_9FIRM|nr:DDE-type integrase/transposase/recombinase [Limnochorda sp. LNt]WRP14970.1 DDE-type integrase/transposase/recombinase [Limnochorda sp. LNt]